jgi:hypothetical protein
VPRGCGAPAESLPRFPAALAHRLLTLDFPAYFPFMTHAKNRELRKEVYRCAAGPLRGQPMVGNSSKSVLNLLYPPMPRRPLNPTRSAYISRASAGETDNGPLIDKILSLRQEKAKLLGFDSFAELSMASKVRPQLSCTTSGCTGVSERVYRPKMLRGSHACARAGALWSDPDGHASHGRGAA